MTTEWLLYLVIGAFAGLSSGLLGLGGGVVAVPLLALVYVKFNMPDALVMHMAAGTSLAAMAVTALTSMYAHHRRGALIWPVFKQFLPGIAIGTFCGALLADFLHSAALSIGFGGFLVVLAVVMSLTTHSTAQRALPKFWGVSAVALILGALSGLLGIGSGSLGVPYLTYCSVPMRHAVGIATACSIVAATIGTLCFIAIGFHKPGLPAFSSGYVYWPAVLIIALVSPIFANLGAALSYHLPVVVLKRIFALMLFVLGGRMLMALFS